MHYGIETRKDCVNIDNAYNMLIPSDRHIVWHCTMTKTSKVSFEGFNTI